MSFNMASLQRPDRRERRSAASAIPILFEFRPMQRHPLHDHTHHPMRQIPKQHGGRADLQYSSMLAITHMDVRRGMIVVVHRHDDTEESTDFGHQATWCTGRRRLSSKERVAAQFVAQRHSRSFARARAATNSVALWVTAGPSLARVPRARSG